MSNQQEQQSSSQRQLPQDLSDPVYAVIFCGLFGIVLGILMGQVFSATGKCVLIGLLLGVAMGFVLYAVYKPGLWKKLKPDSQKDKNE